MSREERLSGRGSSVVSGIGSLRATIADPSRGIGADGKTLRPGQIIPSAARPRRMAGVETDLMHEDRRVLEPWGGESINRMGNREVSQHGLDGEPRGLALRHLI